MPSWRNPEAFERIVTAAHGSATRPRKFLFYFNGMLGRGGLVDDQFVNYSFGLRQQLAALYGNSEARAIVPPAASLLPTRAPPAFAGRC